jgi:hypothetical protein
LPVSCLSFQILKKDAAQKQKTHLPIDSGGGFHKS